MSSELTHTRSCPALTPSEKDACTCGLEWRIQVQTEREMHNAWRKRAEEAEAREMIMKPLSPMSEKQEPSQPQQCNDCLWLTCVPHQCSCECHKKPAVEPSSAPPAAKPETILREALQRIADNYGGCRCDHSTADCCEHPAVGEFCPHCIAELAIALSRAAQEVSPPSPEPWKKLAPGQWFFCDSPNCKDRYSVQERTDGGSTLVCSTPWHSESAKRNMQEIAKTHNKLIIAGGVTR